MLSPSSKFAIRRALSGSDQLSLQDRLQLWEGLIHIIPEGTQEGDEARLNYTLAREALSRQETFLELLES